MDRGKVESFNENKGFGFIVAESGEKVFVHVTDLREKIRAGDEVVFEVQEGKKGLTAVNVSLA